MPSFEYEATTANGDRVISTAFGRDLSEVIQSLSSQGLSVTRIEDAYAKSDPLRTAAPQTAFAAVGQVFAPSPGQGPEIATPTNSRETPSSVSAPQLANSLHQARELPPLGQRNPFLTSIIGPAI